MASAYAIKSWPVWIGFGLLSVCARLPLSWQFWLGDRLGDLLRLAVKSRVRIVQRNLALCFPELSDSERVALCKTNLRSLGRMVIEAGLAWRGRPDQLRRIRRIEGLEHLQRAQEAGQGVLLLSGHFTTLEIGGRLAALDIPDIGGLYREHEDPAMEHLVRESRLRYTQDMFSRDQTRGAVRHLRRGNVLWYAPDQDYRRGGSEFAPMFGIAAATTTSTLDFARLGRAKVMFLHQRRRADGSGYDVSISEPLADFPSADPVADVARINGRIEAMIREVPEQYMWVHRRFKRRPPGEPDLY